MNLSLDLEKMRCIQAISVSMLFQYTLVHAQKRNDMSNDEHCCNNGCVNQRALKIACPYSYLDVLAPRQVSHR